jgi:hypothetical protein
MVRIEPTADASLAAIRDLKRFGIAMAAMIRMIATTINNSMSEKPFRFLVPVLLDIFSPGDTLYSCRLTAVLNAVPEVSFFCFFSDYKGLESHPRILALINRRSSGQGDRYWLSRKT